MKRSRFSEEQIIGISKEHKAGIIAWSLTASLRVSRYLLIGDLQHDKTGTALQYRKDRRRANLTVKRYWTHDRYLKRKGNA